MASLELGWMQGVLALGALVMLYLLRINSLLRGVPYSVRKLAGKPWTKEELRGKYEALEKQQIDYTCKIPPRLARRYIVTGGNGLVGGFIVLQLLARGTPAENIRILDIRESERNDMATGSAARVDFVRTDISSEAEVNAAFNKPWDESISHLPLTVFHTAAVIIPSDRSKYTYGFPEAVNVSGTRNVLEAARAAGADIFSSTSSASIAIRVVDPFVIWAKEPTNFAQVLDERDFYEPLRKRDEFFGNYPASKAVAERIVCEANCETFRTGCIRPANGVYGNPTDNTVGGPLSSSIFPTWIPHIVQSFVHGANVAIAHLHQEAVLAQKNAQQAGRPFVVTDPNPPIAYNDLYNAIATLSVHPFHVISLPPVLMLVMSHIVEWYTSLPYRFPTIFKYLPKISGDAKHLQPGLFSICTHIIGSDVDARKRVADGGLGYEGVLTTMEGMVLEILEWNREHSVDGKADGLRQKLRKSYTTSVSLGDQLRQRISVSNF